MPGKLRRFTDGQIDLLRTIIRRELDSRQNVLRRPFPETGESPEVYIALPPSGGIPALTLGADSTIAGTASGDRDLPGSADCDIYQIVKINGSDVLIPCNFQLTVYNLSQEAISQAWITIFRDKWGKWVCVPPGGSGVLLGKTASSVNSGTSGTVNLYEGATIGSETVTGESVTAYNRHSDTISSGVWVNVMLRADSGSYEMFPLECNP